MSTRDTDVDQPLFERRIPPGDDKERPVCTRCGFVDYSNPKIVVGSVATLGGRFLLCKRAIAPREGFWTLPAGYLENHELPEEGAVREAHEEARAKLKIKDLLAIYSIRHISQIQLMFRAELLDERIEPGPESREVRLFRWHDIPWDELAFPSVRWALRHHRELGDRPVGAPFTNPDGSDGELPGS
ncbi:MAG: NUDIX hydrolase [Deltaproteobacteria bacterium]|nr:NUDIX hydrolase [Deltaproteobacteria bacterium]